MHGPIILRLVNDVTKVVTNIRRSFCKVPVICSNLTKLKFSRLVFSKNSPTQNFVTILSTEAELFHTTRETEIQPKTHHESVVFRSFLKAPEDVYSESVSNFECCTLQLIYKKIKQSLELLSLESYAATEFNDILPGTQPRQDVKVFWRFGNYLRPHLQGAACGLVASKLKVEFLCYQTTSISWRWGWSYFPKRPNTFTSWRGCLPEEMSMNQYYNICIMNKQMHNWSAIYHTALY